MKDAVTQAIDDTKPDLIEAIDQAFRNVRAGINAIELKTAVANQDRARILAALGISADGQAWPALDDAIESTTNEILVAVFAFVLAATYQVLGVPLRNQLPLHDALDDALAASLTLIRAETLQGTLQAIKLMLADHGTHFRADDLYATLGMTDKQVALMFGVQRATRKLRSKLHNITSEAARAAIAAAFLSKLPPLIAGPLRKLVARSNGYLPAFGTGLALQSLTGTLLDHRINPLAEFQVVALAHLAQDQARRAAQQLGYLPADQRKWWVTKHDERVRHAHTLIEKQHPKGVPLDEAFTTPIGPIRFPPAERNCRCRITLDNPHA